MSSTVSFSRGSTDISVNGPSGESRTSNFPRFVTDSATDGTRRSYVLNTSDVKFWTIELDELTTTQKNNLVDFFNDDAEGPNNTFTYTHTDGAVYSGVRFANAELEPVRTMVDQWSVTVIIETTANIS